MMGSQIFHKQPASSYKWWGLPLALWLLFFSLAPLAILGFYSFLTRGPYGTLIYTGTFRNYARATEALYTPIFVQSFLFASGTSLLCLIFALPLAYVMATTRAPWRGVLMAGVMIPFVANFIVRIYGLRAFFGIQGPFNNLLLASGLWQEPLAINDSPVAVAIGMLVNYMPYMTLPIYAAVEKMDFSLVEAARDLGANQTTLFRLVIIPLIRRGLATGCVLVFVPALGEFLIPDLLGGARTMLLGGLISEQFLKARHWPFGAALTFILLLSMLLALGLLRLAGRGDRS